MNTPDPGPDAPSNSVVITTAEHLQLIKAECERLLAVAEKRTPGMWTVHEHRAMWTSYLVRGGEKKNQLAQTFNWQDNGFDINSESNATYIAACAGRAEAGWRATIAAIDCLIDCEELHYCDNDGRDCPRDRPLIRLQNCILAAWPLELLQKP
jgi:hypothetical protein